MLTRAKKVFSSFRKLLNDATAREVNPSFNKISIGDALITLTDDVIKDLSTDHFHGYKIVSAIRNRNIPIDLALLFTTVQLIIQDGHLPR